MGFSNLDSDPVPTIALVLGKRRSGFYYKLVAYVKTFMLVRRHGAALFSTEVNDPEAREKGQERCKMHRFESVVGT